MKLKLVAFIALVMLFCLAANAQSGRKSAPPTANEGQKEDQKTGETRPVKILDKPAPNLEVFSQCFREEGFENARTIVRLVFDASAKITDVQVIGASGCQRFDDEVVRVAREIEFEPARKDGKPITVAKNASYLAGILRRR